VTRKGNKYEVTTVFKYVYEGLYAGLRIATNFKALNTHSIDLEVDGRSLRKPVEWRLRISKHKTIAENVNGGNSR
jgi:hypothetical protein